MVDVDTGKRSDGPSAGWPLLPWSHDVGRVVTDFHHAVLVGRGVDASRVRRTQSLRAPLCLDEGRSRRFGVQPRRCRSGASCCYARAR
jgi:hypothetical protein